MKVTMLMSASINGVICHEDGSEEFLTRSGGQYVTDQAKKLGNVVWGRFTYENIKEFTDTFDKDLEGVKRVIVSSDPSYPVTRGYELASSPSDALKLLAKSGIERALVGGGSRLNRAFLEAELVDEVHITLEPVLVGRGLPLVATTDKEIGLSLLSVDQWADGEVLLKYQVNRGES
jgi:dihydrofolate reductase